MLERSGGWPGAVTEEDKGGNTGSGTTAALSRLNKAANATTRASDAMPIATHGTIVCALLGVGATAAASDAPHSWHARDPGLTVAPHDGQTDTIDVPQ
jgi:hypothetical protein